MSTRFNTARCAATLALALATADLACAAQPDPGASYARRRIAAVETATPPKLNAMLDDPAWAKAARAETFVDSQSGRPVADQTTGYVLYDATYIYVAFHCADSQPNGIVARETVRDSKWNSGGGGGSEDNVTLSLDPFLTCQFGDVSQFSVNARGTPSARLAGGRGAKLEWEGDWDAVAKRVPDGWNAMMRIPWRILNYPPGRKSVTMGIELERWQNRTQIDSVWSDLGPQGFQNREGRWLDVDPPAAAFRPNLSVLPYSLPGAGAGGANARSGLDVRYAATPEITAVSSVNPDFATIEGAVASVQFQHGERFIPDHRPFFLEGGNYIQPESDFNSIGRFFYPERIPDFDLGFKLYGKLTPVDTLGILNTTTFGSRDDSVIRYDRALSPTASAGVVLLHKSAPGDNNTVVVADQDARWGKFEVQSQLAATSGNLAGGGAQNINFLYQDKRAFWGVGLVNVAPLFYDADGLVQFNDYQGPFAFVDWSAQWRHGFWRRFDLFNLNQASWHHDGTPFDIGTDTNLTLETRSDWRLSVETNHDRFNTQNDDYYSVTVTRGVTNRFRQLGMQLILGTQASRPSTFLGPTVSWRLFRRFDFAYAGGIQNLDGVVQQHILTFNYEISPTRAFGGRVILTNSGTNGYCFYKNAGAGGTETYFIIGDPNANRFIPRVAVKFVWAL